VSAARPTPAPVAFPKTYCDGVGVVRFHCCMGDVRRGHQWDCEEQKNRLWFEILNRESRDMSVNEFLDVIPARGPAGSLTNRRRAARMRILMNRGFTVGGREIRAAKVRKQRSR